MHAPHPSSNPSCAEIGTRADAILAAADAVRSLAPITDRDPGFDLTEAYRVAEAIRLRRVARGERPVGRKIGFTNHRMWDAYAVRAPIWGWIYDTTLSDLAPDAGFDPRTLVEPRIEPEIVFGLARAPEAGMDEAALMGCVGWVALGFEMVQSPFPGWRFRAPDTVAAFGLHGALRLGPRAAVGPGAVGHWARRLADFRIALLRDDVAVDHGRAGNVLGGGPLTALKHLVEVLAADPASPAPAAGEVVSTGTLTCALPVSSGERWRTVLDGLPLADIALTITDAPITP